MPFCLYFFYLKDEGYREDGRSHSQARTTTLTAGMILHDSQYMYSSLAGIFVFRKILLWESSLMTN